MRKILKLHLNTEILSLLRTLTYFKLKKENIFQICHVLENPPVQNTICFLLFSKVKSSTNTENLSEIHDCQENIIQ